LGLILGFTVPPDSSDPPPWDQISNVIGWIYFSAWSVSFYPQVFTNYQRQSVAGLSFDYVALNIIGFASYSAYNCALYYNPGIRAEYAAAHGGSKPAVQASDVFFGLHACVLTLVCIFQICIYDKGSQKVARWAIVLIIAIVASYISISTAISLKSGGWWTWLDFLTYMSYLKLCITLLKYTPQVYLNYKRKSTVGWTIYNVLLDFTGGSLSVAQLLIDCGVTGDWSGISGDPVKFGLGFMSMVYDVVFIVQHYCIYRSHEYEELNASGISMDLFGGTYADNEAFSSSAFYNAYSPGKPSTNNHH
jgi:cystinosin